MIYLTVLDQTQIVIWPGKEPWWSASAVLLSCRILNLSNKKYHSYIKQGKYRGIVADGLD